MEEKSVSLQTIDHYFEIEKYDRVVELAKEALEEHHQNEILWYILGYSNYQLDNLQDAEEQLIQAMNLDFDKERVLHVLGYIYMKTERWKDAEDAFLEILHVNPNNAEVHASYALLMKKTGHRKKAIQLIEKAMELDPANPAVLHTYYRMEVMNSNHHLEQLQVLEKYMESGDSECSKLITLGVSAMFQGKMKEAKNHLREAYLMDPENEELYELLEELEIVTHPLMAPNRFIDRIGGPAVFWIVFGVGIIVFRFFKLEKLLIGWAIVYAVIAYYTWISAPLVKWMMKIRR